MFWLRAKCLRTDLVPQMPRKFPLLVPPWSALSEGLLRFYLWSQDCGVPSFTPLGNWGCGEWGSDGLRVGFRTRQGQAGLTQASAHSEPDRGWEFLGSAGFHKAQKLSPRSSAPGVPKQPGVNEITLKKEEISMPPSGMCCDEGHEQTCSRAFWEMEIPSGWNDLYSAKYFILKSPLNRHSILVLNKVQNIFLLAHFQIYWGLEWLIWPLHINMWTH